MNVFSFGQRSMKNLEGLDANMADLALKAITVSEIDFAITEGMRTINRQKEMVRLGLSKTMKSKHLEGKAFDVVAFVGNRISYELPLYYEIAKAVKVVAHQFNLDVVWGGCWKKLSEIKDFEKEVLAYVARQKAKGERVLIDAVHFELYEAKSSK